MRRASPVRRAGPVKQAVKQVEVFIWTIPARFTRMNFRACLYEASQPGPVSRKSRDFTGHFRASQFLFYLKNGEYLSRQTSQ